MNVRAIAVELLYNIIAQNAYLNIELDQAIRKNNLSDKDRALLTNIVYGSIQNYQLLLWELNQVIDKKKYKNKIKMLLISSLYQLRYLTKIPSYAIINEAVEIAKTIDDVYTSNFVNAVLNRLNKERFIPKIEDFPSKWDYYSLIYSHPLWLIKMWIKHYGEDITLKLLENSLIEAPLSLRVNTLKTTKEELLKKDYFLSGNLSKDAIIYTGKQSLNELDEFKQKLIQAQDESSQEVSFALNPVSNSKVLDMCAAPGSKTSHLATIMQNQGEIVAVDIHAHRLELIKKGLERTGINIVKTLNYDALELQNVYPNNSFDYILLDAPCSGFGVLRRKSDMLINTKQESLDELIALQAKLLMVAVDLLKVGGRMVYSTCTLNKKENENQINDLLAKRKDLKLIQVRTIFPFEYNSDGFFYAILKKEGSE